MADIKNTVEAAEEPRKLNFLEEIIERDLAEGKYDSILTRLKMVPSPLSCQHTARPAAPLW